MLHYSSKPLMKAVFAQPIIEREIFDDKFSMKLIISMFCYLKYVIPRISRMTTTENKFMSAERFSDLAFSTSQKA